MEIPRDTITRLVALKLGKNLQPVMQIIGEMLAGDARKRGCSLPAGWRPSEELYQYGEALGLSRVQVDGQAEEMTIWASANANRAIARKADWDLTFKGWMRRSHKAPSRLSNGANHGSQMSYGEIADRLRSNGNGNGSGSHDRQGALSFDYIPTEPQPRR